MRSAPIDSGVTLALHPEAFTVLRDNRDADRFTMLTDPAYVGLCPDTAQFSVVGSSPIGVARRDRDRLLLTHWKDTVGPVPADVPIDETISTRQVQWFAPVGAGVVDWPAWMRLPRDVGYRGWAVLELDAAVDPVGELRRIRRYVEGSLRLSIYR